MSVAITIDKVIKRYGDNTVVKGLSLDIKPGEFFTLLGPSGCGKTTLLRMIIGFNSIDGGTIKIDNQVINDIPVNMRNMGMVFQNYAIFPHMSVAQNVAFGLRQRHLPEAKIKEQVEEILNIVKIGHLKERMPTQLSGGQQQRVALARAIVIHPQVLLMDEPLSNLDAKLRVEMRNAIKRIQQQIGITTVYVTHDQEEALAVSDRIAVMHEGIIQQVGSPKAIYQRPKNQFVSTFIGLSNIIKASLTWVKGLPALAFDHYVVPMSNLSWRPLLPEAELSSAGKSPEQLLEGRTVTVAVRPEEFIIQKEGQEGIEAVVRSSVFLGVTTHYFMELVQGGKEIEVIQPSEVGDIIPDGRTVKLLVDASKINVFTEDGLISLTCESGDKA
jgi:iron(III) transport system ATP-binding protein